MAENILELLASFVSTFATDGVNQRKIRGKSVVREWTWITLTILNEDMDDVIRIIKLIKKSNLVLDGGINIVKHKKIQERGLMLVLLEGLDGSMLGNIMNEKYVMKVGKGFVSTGKKCCMSGKTR